MTTQADLFLGVPARFAHLVHADRTDYLLSILRDGRWHTAKELRVYGFSDRELRELVENSQGQILSFPGSPGYKLFELATIDEIDQNTSFEWAT